MHKLPIFALACATTLMLAIPTSEKIHSGIAGLHTKTFAVDNFYEQRLNTTEWNNLIIKTYDLVKEHADNVEKSRRGLFGALSKSRSSTVKQSKFLMQDYEKIKRANDELVNTLKIAYGELSGSKSKKDPELIEQFSKKFAKINSTMEELRKELAVEGESLKNKIKSETSKDKKELLEEQEQIVSILHRLALTLAITAQKAQKDLMK